MDISPRQQLEMVFRIGRKWQWYGIVSGLVVFVLGAGYAMATPTQYTATATLSVDEDAPNPLLRDLNLDQRRQKRMETIHEAIRTWEILTQTAANIGPTVIVANAPSFTAYVRTWVGDRLMQERETSVEAASAQLNAALEVRGWTQDLVRISYTALDAQVATDVTNSLVHEFVAQTSHARQLGAEATMQFIANQVEAYRNRLEESEARVRTFRQEHLQALPTQFTNQIGLLAGSQAELMSTDIALRESFERANLLKQRITQTEERIIAERTTSANPIAAELDKRILEARVELATLRTNYTEEHPRVIALEAHVANLRAALEEESETTVTSETATMNPTFESLTRALQESEIEHDTLKMRRTALLERIETVERAVRSIPGQEQELIQLTRDSSVNASIYNLLLRKLQEAQISQELAGEEGSLGQLTVIENARVATVRTGPNRVQLLLFAVLAACGVAMGVILVRHTLDESYDDADQLAEAFGLPCLTVIPRIDAAV